MEVSPNLKYNEIQPLKKKSTHHSTESYLLQALGCFVLNIPTHTHYIYVCVYICMYIYTHLYNIHIYVHIEHTHIHKHIHHSNLCIKLKEACKEQSVAKNYEA